MAKHQPKFAAGVRSLDPVWARVREEAEEITQSAPELAAAYLGRASARRVASTAATPS